MRRNEFMLALNALCTERDLSKEVVFDAIESALHAAYRRDFEHDPNVTVSMDRATGKARVFLEWNVVERVENTRTEIALEKARAKFGSGIQVGEVVREERTPRNFGRIAAQTAKQVILQRIREAERDRLYHDYASREQELVVGTVQSIDPKSRTVRLSLGKAEAVLPRNEQIPGERYRVGQRIRAFVAEVSRAHRGPQIVVSRTHRQMLRRLLELEVPEIANGTIELRAIAREPGARSKVAVLALQAGVDPVGACVGMKGIRIQSIVSELGGEKIDIVQWNPDETIYVANALSPAKVVNVFLEENNTEGKTAIVVVPDKQLSLAIGKEGQNARLAAKLTGWRIDIKSASEASEERVRLTKQEARRQKDEQRRQQEEEARLAAARALLAEAEDLFDFDDDDSGPLGSVSIADEIAFGTPVLEDLSFEDDLGDDPFGAEDDLFSETTESTETPTVDETAKKKESDLDEMMAEDDFLLEEDDFVLDMEDDFEASLPAEPAPKAVEVKAKPAAKPIPKPAPKPVAVKAVVSAKPAPAKPTPAKPAPAKPKQVAPAPKWEPPELEEEELLPPDKQEGPMIFYTLNSRGEAQSLHEAVSRKKRKKGKKKKGRRSRRGQYNR